MSRGGQVLGQTLYDVAQLLESADDADNRVRRVLEHLRDLVPYDQCAMLEAGLGYEPRVVLVPEVLSGAAGPLLGTLLDLFGQLVGANPRGSQPSRPLGEHLAVPLVGLDEVVGLLFVRSSSGGYTEDHLRQLSVVAANLAAYLTTLRGRAELTALAREREEAARAAELARCVKDDLLALLYRELDGPLDTILECTRVLRLNNDAPPVRARLLDAIERAVQVQARLIGGIRDRAGIASPESRADDADLRRPAEARATALAARVGGPADERQLDGVRVLLVDQDLCLRESVQAALDLHGAQVTSVGSAADALAAIERWRPDVLLFGDLPIGGGSVYELMREVTVRTCPLPVASISAWRFEERRRERAAGFQLHLAKPLEIGALVEAVAALAGPRRARGPLLFAVAGPEQAPEGPALKQGTE